MNVFGVGFKDKKMALRFLVNRFNLVLLCVIEMKLVVVNEKLINSIWDRNTRYWVVALSVGISRGIIYVWDSSYLYVMNIIVDMNGRVIHIEGKYSV